MGSHSAIYSVLQLHVVNLNQNVLKWFKIRKQMKKWQKCQEPHTPSVMEFVGRSEGRLFKSFPVSVDA